MLLLASAPACMCTSLCSTALVQLSLKFLFASKQKQTVESAGLKNTVGTCRYTSCRSSWLSILRRSRELISSSNFRLLCRSSLMYSQALDKIPPLLWNKRKTESCKNFSWFSFSFSVICNHLKFVFLQTVWEKGVWEETSSHWICHFTSTKTRVESESELNSPALSSCSQCYSLGSPLTTAQSSCWSCPCADAQLLE